MTASRHAEAHALLEDLLKRARAAGADAADAVLVDSASLSLGLRFGQTEKLERSEEGDLGLRVFVGKRQAIVSSSDRAPQALRELAERAVAMARVVPEDPYCGLADPGEIARDWPDLDLDDPDEPSAETLIAGAKAAEDAALAVEGVTNSEGAEAGWSRSSVAVAATNGFVGAYSRTGRYVSVSALAGSGTAMERDYDFASAVYGADLRDPAGIGRSAGEKAVRRLGARKMGTKRAPIVFDPRVARGFLSTFAGAISGPEIARGVSFLKDKMGQRVFAEGVRIVDDPLIRRGQRSKPFDGEGLAAAAMDFVTDGVLQSWILDLRSARQLGLRSVARASRGTSSPPSPAPTNLYMAAGRVSRDQLIGDVQDGFYVTEMMGQGANMVTGDYSRGAAGFWIENGQIAYPVSEVTVAGNLKDMFLNLTPADDLEFRYGVDAPTLRIDGMTVAGR